MPGSGPVVNGGQHIQVLHTSVALSGASVYATGPHALGAEARASVGLRDVHMRPPASSRPDGRQPLDTRSPFAAWPGCVHNVPFQAVTQARIIYIYIYIYVSSAAARLCVHRAPRSAGSPARSSASPSPPRSPRAPGPCPRFPSARARPQHGTNARLRAPGTHRGSRASPQAAARPEAAPPMRQRQSQCRVAPMAGGRWMRSPSFGSGDRGSCFVSSGAADSSLPSPPPDSGTMNRDMLYGKSWHKCNTS